jgi:hypothetical protein
MVMELISVVWWMSGTRRLMISAAGQEQTVGAVSTNSFLFSAATALTTPDVSLAVTAAVPAGKATSRQGWGLCDVLHICCVRTAILRTYDHCLVDGLSHSLEDD